MNHLTVATFGIDFEAKMKLKQIRLKRYAAGCPEVVQMAYKNTNDTIIK